MKIKIVKGLMTLFLITMMQQASAAIPASERNALIALYNSTDGDNWADNTGWLGSPGTECNWEGVECIGNSITKIYLGSNRLTGSIPPELGQLSQLTELYLWGNKLTGNLPSELGKLSLLTILALYENQLTGDIPPELGQLSQLTELYLYENQLTGTFPSELGQLSLLTELYLWGNQLAGSLPPELRQLPQKKRITVLDNTLLTVGIMFSDTTYDLLLSLEDGTEVESEVEPNNSPNDAEGIRSNEYKINQFNYLGDEDWLIFYSSPFEVYSIRAYQENPDIAGQKIHLALEIYNESGEVVVGLLNSISHPTLTLAYGAYYIRVTSAETTFNPVGSYKIIVNGHPTRFFVNSLGTIQGKVIDSCTKIGIKDVIIENSSTKQSTKSFGKNGIFGMSTYPGIHIPITISHKGYKAQEDIINIGEDCRGCNGKHVDLGTIQLVPIESCNNPPINIFTSENAVGFIPGPDFFSDIEHIEIESLKQQAIAVYDDVTGILTIKEVKVGNDIFEAILKENQYSIFTLVSAVPLSKGLSSNPAIFNFDTKLAEIPDVFYLNQLYSMQLRQLPSGNTFIIQNKILLP